jgi:hypothetical protein
VSANTWQDPPGSTPAQLYRWAQDLTKAFRQGKHRDYELLSITLTAGMSTVVAAPGVTTNARVFLFPKNAAAAALNPYRSATSAGTSFTLTHGVALGTETFDGLVIR